MTTKSVSKETETMSVISDGLTAEIDPNNNVDKSIENPRDNEMKIALNPIPADIIIGMDNSWKWTYLLRNQFNPSADKTETIVPR